MGWIDDPDHQCRRTLRWDPATGHLVVFGTIGAGTTTALRTVAVALAAEHPSDALHLYAVDFGAGGMATLAALPHVGAVVGANERERLERLVGRLVDEAARRRAGAACSPRVVVLVDDLPGLLASVSDVRSAALHDALRRLVADGPAVGITFACSATGPHALPLAVLGSVAHRWVLRLADPAEALSLGVRVTGRRTWPAGRGDDVGSGLEIQIADVTDDDVAAVARSATAGARPEPIGVLPDVVPVHAVSGAADVGPGEWVLPIGVGGTTLGAVGFRLGAGDHVLVTGPARAGRTTALRTLARVVAGTAPFVERIAVCGRSSGLAADAAITRVVEAAELPGLATDLAARSPWALVLVDDADAVDDPTGALVALVRGGPPHVHVIAAAAADRILGEYGHWTRELRRSRLGLALRPMVDRDGEVWHTALPRQAPGGFGPGRGYLVHPDGHELVQVASPGRDAVSPLRRSA
jgi:S-DNA-T family DNA segregation ATPase FtsK/SpoIIIE